MRDPRAWHAGQEQATGIWSPRNERAGFELQVLVAASVFIGLTEDFSER